MTVLASDQFGGGDLADISGRTTDSGLGGSGKTWAKGAGTRLVSITSGACTHNATAGTINTYAFDAGAGDVFVTIKLNSLTTSGQFLSLLARQDTTLATQTHYRLLFSVASNALQLSKVVANTVTSLGAAQTWANGDTIGLRLNGSAIDVVKNGTTIVSVTDSAIANTNTKMGIRPSATATFSLDDFLVQTPAATVTAVLAGPSTSAGSITAVPKVFATLAGASTSAGVITAVPKVLATLAGASTSSGSASATPTVLATLSGSSASAGSLSATPKHLAVLAGPATSAGSAVARVTHLATLAGAAPSAGLAVFGPIVLASFAGSSTSAGSATAHPVRLAVLAGPSTSAGAATATPKVLALAAGASTSAGHADFTVAATIVYATLVGSSTSAGHFVGPIPLFPTQSGVYVTDNRREYDTDNRATYRTDNRRTYAG